MIILQEPGRRGYTYGYSWWNTEPLITGNMIKIPSVVQTKEDIIAEGHEIRTVKMMKPGS